MKLMTEKEEKVMRERKHFGHVSMEHSFGDI